MVFSPILEIPQLAATAAYIILAGRVKNPD
jgi:hypothetical protein